MARSLDFLGQKKIWEGRETSDAAVNKMGVSVSLLSAATTVLIAAGCFAAGYLLALSSLQTHRYDDDEKDNNLRRRLLQWAPSILAGKPRAAVTEAEVDGQGLRGKQKVKKPALEIENLAEILEDFKMVLVVRNDLKMGKGKIAAQCSHATLGLYKKLNNRAPKALSRWEMYGQAKVVLKIESEEDMLVLQERAKSLMLPTHVTIDAGRTHIAPNSRTVMAVLGPADVVDDVTGGLKLL